MSAFRRANRRAAAALTTLALAAALGACNPVSGPQGEQCGPPPYFTVLPAAADEITAVSVFGGLGAPGHTLPTAHAGYDLARNGVPLRSPGDIAVTEIRRVTYTASPNREGVSDYAIFFQVCKEVTGWWGHVASLAPAITSQGLDFGDCETYSTPIETVEACTAETGDLKVAAGALLGTGGIDVAAGFSAVDFGMLDDRVNNRYVSPWRYPDATFHAVCPWEQFDAVNREILLSKLQDPMRPAVPPQGEPRCGTMEVDVAGTAKGAWAETGVTAPLQGDERRYITLADYPYRPQTELALSLGPESLGATVAAVPRQTSGRINRAFEQVTPDGQIYCYSPAEAGATASWLLLLTSGTTLRIERVAHAAGASPCDADPSTWSFGPGALDMER